MPSFWFVTTCNKPCLRDPTRARAIIEQFWFDWDLAVAVFTDEDGQHRLNIRGEGWPAAWQIPEGCQADNFVPDYDSDGLADFKSFLEEIGPCLDEPLIVQAVGTVQGQFPLLADEWSIAPEFGLRKSRELTGVDSAPVETGSSILLAR